MTSTPSLEVAPARAATDVALAIRLSGLPPGSRVAVSSRMLDGGLEWGAEAVFEADSDGELDLERCAPSAGSYAGADAMGLVWSMQPVDPARRYDAGVKPADLEPVTITFEASVDGRAVARSRAVRLRLPDGVERIPVDEGGVCGTLFVPAGAERHPAIIVLSGSDGGLWEALAALYAAHGYAALALAYFNHPSLPDALLDIPIEYFEAAIAWLQAHPRIDGERLAVTGMSRGGELALLLGALCPQLKTVVASVPSAVAWGGFGGAPALQWQPAWRHRGKAVPFMDGDIDPNDNAYVQAYLDRGEPVPTTPGFLRQLDKDPARVRRAAIPVENTQGAILMLSGRDDAMWPSTRLAQLAVERLRDHDFAHPFEHVSYAGAGHIVQPPYGPCTVLATRHPVDGTLYALGGDPPAIAAAAVGSWGKTLDFLGNYL